MASFCTGAGVFALDPGQHGGDVAVLAIKRKAALLIVPGEAGETAFDRGNSQWFRRRGRGGAFRNVEADQLLRLWGNWVRTPAPAPTGEMRPVGFVGGVGIFAQSLAGIIFGGIDQPVESA